MEYRSFADGVEILSLPLAIETEVSLMKFFLTPYKL